MRDVRVLDIEASTPMRKQQQPHAAAEPLALGPQELTQKLFDAFHTGRCRAVLPYEQNLGTAACSPAPQPPKG